MIINDLNVERITLDETELAPVNLAAMAKFYHEYE
jgi:hypothetical protein